MQKKYIYPAILYFDSEINVYILNVHDLGLIAEAQSVEEVHIKAAEFLKSYIKYAIKYDCEIPSPTEFDIIAKSHPKEMCLLVETSV